MWRVLIVSALLGVSFFSTPSRSSVDGPEFLVEFRVTQQGRLTKVAIRTEPAISQTAMIYFETSADPGPLERLELHAKQASTQEAIPDRFISTAFAYQAKYRREKHQKLDRVILQVESFMFAIVLDGEEKDGQRKLVVAASVDQDKDGAFAEAQILRASRRLRFCPDYDANALAHPLQTAFFAEDRGDGSLDWNCNGKINLAKVTLGKPGTYALRNGVCVETSPPVPGWKGLIPTKVGTIAHCYITLPSSNESLSVVPLDVPNPVCPQIEALCIQEGN